jgi:hypothetical protein
MLVAPAESVTVAGTVATDGLLELRLTVSPAADAAERLRVRFCAALPLMVRAPGNKLIVMFWVVAPVTCTCVLATGYPGADAVIVAVPAVNPVTAVERRAGVVIPSGMKTACGEMSATDELVLARVMFTPPEGAIPPNATGKFAEDPAVMDVLPGKMIPTDEGCVTVTPAVALPAFDAFAVIVAVPAAIAVRATGALLAPAGMVTADGTVATLVLLELRLTVIGDAAEADRLIVRF